MKSLFVLLLLVNKSLEFEAILLDIEMVQFCVWNFLLATLMFSFTYGVLREDFYCVLVP